VVWYLLHDGEQKIKNITGVQVSWTDGYYTKHRKTQMIVAFKGTLHSKLTLGFFSWPKSICYCDLSLTNCTFVKLELRVLTGDMFLQ